MYWLEMIEPEDVKEKAIANHLAHVEELKADDEYEEEEFYAESIADAIYAAFQWDSTEEGQEYWATVADEWDFYE